MSPQLVMFLLASLCSFPRLDRTETAPRWYSVRHQTGPTVSYLKLRNGVDYIYGYFTSLHPPSVCMLFYAETLVIIQFTPLSLPT